ncbi:glutathione transferase [Aquabacterium sp.]|uniref:glutathione transferase n=1 Tax=Aquabacterium sp. TaxID=1872578 RepID=UPI0019CB8CD7|nr:glutathione transferase [Aquabacterium sp.]MBC7701400.1 glutathione transferase [Aquabacterium sp.]
MSSNLTLYVDSRFFSPYAMFAFVALTEKKIPFAIEKIDLVNNAHHTSGYQHLSLTGRVPTLAHGDFSVSESSAIIEYLDDAFPAPHHLAVLPASLRDRARARQLQAWLRSDLMPLREDRPTTVIFQQPSALPLSPSGQAAAQQLITVASSLINDAGDNLFGAWSIADTELALMLNRLVLNQDPVPPSLKTYVARQWQRPSVQAWIRQQG